MKELKPFYRRRLPHYQPLDSILFVTFRLANSLPNEIIQKLFREQEERKREIALEKNSARKSALIAEEHKRYFGHFDSYLDQLSTNIRWLENPDIATIVYNAIVFFHAKEYDVIAFCIMPNHVHLVADMKRTNHAAHNILKRIKTYSAVHSNLLLHRKGNFWQRENYDRVVRDGNELRTVIEYVIQNPVKAFLCLSWEKWPWTYVNFDYLK